MTPGARLASAADILDTLDVDRPIDSQLKAWARANRYAGSKDRKAIADRVYACLRKRRSFASRAGGDTGRAVVLGSLVDEDGLQSVELAALCSGGYALEPLSNAERDALSAPMPYADIGEQFDWPDWLLPEARRVFGTVLTLELDALRQRAPLDLRVNMLKATVDEARAALAREGLDADTMALCDTALRLSPGSPVLRSAAYRDGLVEPQDAASQAVAEFTAVRSGETVLDYCAGAGGKTLALAAMMKDRGRLVAHDVAPVRMVDLPDRSARAGASIIEIAKMADLPKAAFDCVLVDAPCSGSGSWRRDPAGKWRLDPARLDDLLTAQRDALSAAAGYVRPGGRLIYATCSVLTCENDDQTQWFTQTQTDFDPGDVLALHPARDRADGFFAMRFRRGPD